MIVLFWRCVHLANSKIISDLKSKVIQGLVNNDEIVKAIDSPDKDKLGWEPLFLLDTVATEEQGFKPLIFREFKNPNLITDVCTFITVIVQIPQSLTSRRNEVEVNLEIGIYSHNKHMRVDNVSGVKDNRNDYLSMLIDSMFNSRDGNYGTDIKLESNTEGAFNETFNYRRMVFSTRCVNTSNCSEN